MEKTHSKVVVKGQGKWKTGWIASKSEKFSKHMLWFRFGVVSNECSENSELASSNLRFYSCIFSHGSDFDLHAFFVTSECRLAT